MSSSPATPSRHPSRPSQWLFTKSETRSTPSIKEGLDPKQERSNRLKGIQFIDSVGRKLRLQQPTIATAAMFFHRFFMRQTMQRFHYYDVAATSIFLATKVEENPCKLPDLITAAARFTQHSPSLEIDEQSKEYWKWRDTILYTEEHLLEGLCFDFDVIHPYEYLTKLVDRFCWGNRALGKCAWAFINDSHRTMIQVMYPAHVIAASAFYFARKFTHSHIPNSPDGKEWWEQYGVRIEDLRDVVLAMVDVYNSLPHLGYEGKYPPAVVSPQDSGRGIPQRNGISGDESGQKNTTETTEKKMENEMKKENIPEQPPREQQEKSPPPAPPPPPPPPEDTLPQPPKERSTNIPNERGRSSTRRSRENRSRSPRREYSCSRSRSRGSRGSNRSGDRGGGGGRRHIDWYISPERRRPHVDTYIPPRPGKRSHDGSPRGREKRRRSVSEDDGGEMSEGEVR